MNMANNTYTGGTNLVGGVLEIGASSRLPAARWPPGPWAPDS